MYRLCYISTSRSPITRQVCEEILEVSRRNNERDGMTGLLIAGQRRFLQALEGEESDVRRAYDRISADPRHFACVILQQADVSERQFAQWTMGFEQGHEGEGALSDAQYAAAMIGQVADPNLRAQFEGFLTLQWRSDRAA